MRTVNRTTSPKPRKRGLPLAIALVGIALLCVLGAWAWRERRPLRQAREALQDEQWFEVIVAARKYLARHPNSDEARRLIARGLAKRGLWDESDQMYNSLPVPSPEDRRRQADGLVHLQKWFEAARVLEQLLIESPDDPHGLQQLTVLRAKQGRELEAIEHAKRLVALPDRTAVGYAMLATLHQNRDNLLGAVDCWNKVLELDPDCETLPATHPPQKVRLDLAGCYLKVSRWQESLPHIEYVEQRWPNEFQVLLLRGWVWMSQGEPEKAVPYWEQNLKMNPSSCDVLTKLGEAKLQLQEAEEAVALLERAVEICPDDSQIHAVLAKAYRATGNHELQRKHLERSKELREVYEEGIKADLFMQLDPEAIHGMRVKSAQLAREGKWHEAEQWALEALRNTPDDEATQRLLDDIRARRKSTWLKAP